MEDRIQRIHERGGVEVLKASAGSGKTFSLAREYIRLLLQADSDGRRDETAYRHILAVTFTNKATAEMKNRIIEELDKLSTDPSSSDFKDYLLEKCGFTDTAELQQWSGKILSSLLNDFGAFSVSTIDKFFQSTLRAFSREIGQFAEYQIELDRDSLVAEASARVLESISESDKALMRWIADSSIQQMEEGKGYRLDRIIGDFANGYLSTGYAEKIKTHGIDEAKAFSEENIRKLNGICRKIIRSYKDQLDTALQEAWDTVKDDPDVNKNIRKNIVKLMNLDHKGVLDISGISTIEKAAADGKEGLQIQQALRKIMDLLEDPLKIRNTAVLLSGQSYVFRVADALNKEFKALLKEKNVLCIDDTNEILKGIIGDTDAPFIYEKTGTRYRHFLLDEFQDTSRIQWENFINLLRNSIAEGCYNLIVGDVKQSIYRWRHSDWKILDEEVAANLDNVLDHPLDHNWRSARNIVEFNNTFYRELAAHMDSNLKRTLPDGSMDRRIERIYADVKQHVTKAVGTSGCVEATYCESKRICSNVVEAVRQGMARGFDLKDMAVIVRTNSYGSKMAEALMNAGMDVVTNDSLRISTGKAVRRLVAQLYRFNDPNDTIHTLDATELDKKGLDNANSLTDLAEEIIRQTHPQGDDLYLLAFMDLLRDFVERNGNSLDAFLKFWEEEGAHRSVSSPEGSNAVTIITIHKVKGLDYPYVILPFQAKAPFMKADARYWEYPCTENTPFEDACSALYHVGLSSKSKGTLFYDNFLHEQQMAFIDNANLWYVAMTRASQCMHIIGPLPSKEKRNGWTDFSNICEATYMYITQPGSNFQKADPMLTDEEGDEHYILGSPGEKWIPQKKKAVPATIELRFTTGSPEAAGSRLKISSDSKDFFSESGGTGISASNRLKGTVLHKILEEVITEDQLHKAVLMSATAGEMDETQMEEAEALLSYAIKSVSEKGWFSSGESIKVICERGIIDTDGSNHRPDRVVIFPDHVDIIDYKFGKEEKSYLKQIRSYVELYKRMGYRNVRAYLWYIGEDTHVEEV